MNNLHSRPDGFTDDEIKTIQELAGKLREMFFETEMKLVDKYPSHVRGNAYLNLASAIVINIIATAGNSDKEKLSEDVLSGFTDNVLRNLRENKIL